LAMDLGTVLACRLLQNIFPRSHGLNQLVTDRHV
jgi:hypothetical protein